MKAYIHCNPNNPLGDVYNEEQNLQLMNICAKHKIHFISDEIYAFTIHDAQQSKNFKRLEFYLINVCTKSIIYISVTPNVLK